MSDWSRALLRVSAPLAVLLWLRVFGAVLRLGVFAVAAVAVFAVFSAVPS